MRRALWWQFVREELLVLGSVSLHGVRTINLPRKSARHRSVPSLYGEQALPHGIPE